MVELIRAEPYDHITVQEITDRADVGRSTFYAHFTHKDDLLVDGVHRMLDHLDTAIGTVAGMLVTAIRTWVENGLNGSAESIDRAFHIAAGPAIRAGLRPTDNGSPAA